MQDNAWDWLTNPQPVQTAPLGTLPQPVQPKPNNPIAGISSMIAPAASVGALSGNPLIGALSGAGMNMLLNYFNRKYKNGGSGSSGIV
jgi:hypothetical protein